MRSIGIYVHIPFCIQKCLYCDFNSYPLKKYEQVKQYIRFLKKDIKQASQELGGCEIKTIYLGGGTPSLLKANDIAGILNTINKCFPLINNIEITLEANPATVSLEKIKQIKKLGVNRISLGVQSFNDRFLKALGRIHTNTDTQNTLSLLRKTGFGNVGIDLMYGLPEQTLSLWLEDLDKFISLKLEHISFYDLNIEKNTPFYSMRKRLKLPPEDVQAKMYKLGCKKLEKAGYIHYEISSFAKPQKESRHNQIYWHNKEYLGVGAGAYSYLKGQRFGKDRDISCYIEQAKKGYFKQYDLEKLNKKQRLKETVILNLRILKGFSLKGIIDARGSNGLLGNLNQLKQEGLLVKTGDRYRLSKKGILFYDTVAASILC